MFGLESIIVATKRKKIEVAHDDMLARKLSKNACLTATVAVVIGLIFMFLFGGLVPFLAFGIVATFGYSVGYMVEQIRKQTEHAREEERRKMEGDDGNSR